MFTIFSLGKTLVVVYSAAELEAYGFKKVQKRGIPFGRGLRWGQAYFPVDVFSDK